MKYSPYSYSRISTWNQCPRKFKYSYVDKIKVPFQYNEALIKGGCVHHILENHPEKSTHKHQEKYQHIADKFLETDIAKDAFTGDNSREVDIGLTEALIPCDYNCKDAMFRGSVDFITLREDALILIDWKTGSVRDEKYMDYNQLSWYAIYFFIKYSKINKIKISYVYIEHENEHKTKEYLREDLGWLIQSLKDNILKIEYDKSYTRKIGPLCNYCDYQDHCDNERVQELPNSFFEEL